MATQNGTSKWGAYDESENTGRAFGKHTVVVSGIEMSKSSSQQHPTTPKRKRNRKERKNH